MLLQLIQIIVGSLFGMLVLVALLTGIFNILFQLPGDVEKIAKEMKRYNDREEGRDKKK